MLPADLVRLIPAGSGVITEALSLIPMLRLARPPEALRHVPGEILTKQHGGSSPPTEHTSGHTPAWPSSLLPRRTSGRPTAILRALNPGHPQAAHPSIHVFAVPDA